MVGLHGPAGDDRIGSLCQGVAQAELQLPGLVAAGGTGKQVVSFDIKIDPFSQCPAQGRHGLDGGGGLDIFSSWESRKIHGVSFIFFCFSVIMEHFIMKKIYGRFQGIVKSASGTGKPG
jgi:hypothetical protein